MTTRRRLGPLTVGIAASGATTFLVNVVAARSLKSDEYAAFAVLLALAIAGAQLAISSICPLLIRRISAASAGSRQSVVISALTLSLMGGGLSAAIVVVAAPLAGIDGLGNRLAIGAACLAYSQYFAMRSLYLATDQLAMYARREITIDVLVVAAVASAGAVTHRADVALMAFAAVYATGVGVWMRWDRLRMSRSVRANFGRADAQFGGWTLVATYTSVSLIPMLVVWSGRVDAPDTTAALAAAVAIAAPALLIPQALGALSFVDVSRPASAIDHGHRLTIELAAVAGIAGLVAVALRWIGPAAIGTIFGLEGTDVTPVVSLIGVAVAFRALAAPIGGSLAASRHYRRAAAIVILSAGLACLTVVIADALGSPMAAAWGAVTGSVAVAIGLAVQAMATFGTDRRMTLAALVPGLAVLLSIDSSVPVAATLSALAAAASAALIYSVVHARLGRLHPASPPAARTEAA